MNSLITFVSIVVAVFLLWAIRSEVGSSTGAVVPVSHKRHGSQPVRIKPTGEGCGPMVVWWFLGALIFILVAVAIPFLVNNLMSEAGPKGDINTVSLAGMAPVKEENVFLFIGCIIVYFLLSRLVRAYEASKKDHVVDNNMHCDNDESRSSQNYGRQRGENNAMWAVAMMIIVFMIGILLVLYVPLLAILQSMGAALIPIGYFFIYKCGDCDKEVDRIEVDEGRFERMRDRVYGQLDKWGEQDNSPDVKEQEIIFYKTLCRECEAALREYQRKDNLY